MAFKLKIIKQKGSCYIKLPEKFCEDIEVDKCEELQATITPRGKLELSKLTEGNLCQVCRKTPHKNNKCINCGNLVCAGCFWELGSLCYNCMSTGKGK